MIKRWLKIIQKRIPTIDFIDISHSMSEHGRIQQFAPLYSQKAYESLQEHEIAVGDYVTEFPQLVNHEERHQVILLIEDLHK